MSSVETIVRQVRDFGERERHVLEHVLGRQLQENQQIIIQVVNPGSDAAQLPEGSDAAASDELPDWCNVYEGLTEKEIAELESVMLERANLTRPS